MNAANDNDLLDALAAWLRFDAPLGLRTADWLNALERLRREHAAMREAIELIQHGLTQGTIKAQPMIQRKPDATEWPITTLTAYLKEKLADAQLNKDSVRPALLSDTALRTIDLELACSMCGHIEATTLRLAPGVTKIALGPPTTP